MIRLISKFIRSCIEDPTIPLTGQTLEFAFDGSNTATTGVLVNHETVLTYSSVWRAVTLISDSVGKLPLITYKGKKGNRKDAESHALYNILKWKTSENHTSFVWKKLIISRLLLRGNAYCAIIRNKAGNVVSLQPLTTDTYPIMYNGKLWYISKANNKDIKLRADEVLHFRGLGDELEGHSIVAKAKDSFGLGMGAAKYGSKFFRNNATPAVVIKYPRKLSDTALSHLRTSWTDMHSGINNAGKPALAEEGTDIQAIGISNSDAQFLETRQFEIKEVANWFGLPAHKLGDNAKVSYNSLEQENQAYLNDCLDPILVMLEMEMREKLMTATEKSKNKLTIEFNRNALVRVDIKSRYASYAIGLTNGILSPNECRGFENLNEYEGGDEFMRMLNQGSVDDDSSGDEPDEPKDEPKDDDKKEEEAEEAKSVLKDDTVRRMKARLEKAKNPEEHRAFLLETLTKLTDVTGGDPEHIIENLYHEVLS